MDREQRYAEKLRRDIERDARRSARKKQRPKDPMRGAMVGVLIIGIGLLLLLNNLGIVQRTLNDLESARESYREALAIYRELARQRPDVYRPNVADRGRRTI